MDDTGLESIPDFPTNSVILTESGAKSDATHAPADNLADSAAESRSGDSPRGRDADPLLSRLLDAWHRLCDADRLRMVDDAEQLADAAGDAVDAQTRRETNLRP
jgi:hypothetical protein